MIKISDLTPGTIVGRSYEDGFHTIIIRKVNMKPFRESTIEVYLVNRQMYDESSLLSFVDGLNKYGWELL